MVAPCWSSLWLPLRLTDSETMTEHHSDTALGRLASGGATKMLTVTGLAIDGGASIAALPQPTLRINGHIRALLAMIDVHVDAVCVVGGTSLAAHVHCLLL